MKRLVASLQQLKETLTYDVIMTGQQIVVFRGGGDGSKQVRGQRQGPDNITHIIVGDIKI